MSTNCVAAVDSSQAIDFFTSHSVDKLILECHLHGVSGDVIARRMKAIKPTVLILTLSGTISKEKLKPVEAFLFKADSITVFLDVVKTLLNTCRPTLNACAIPDRSNQKSEEAMDEFGAAAQARAACESFASDQRRSLFHTALIETRARVLSWDPTC
jgi:hypothetical protein